METPASAPGPVVAVVLVGAGLAVGLLGRYALGRLAARGRANRWEWDDHLWTFLHDIVAPLCVTGSLWMATLAYEPTERTVALVSQILMAVAILTVTIATARLAGGFVSSMTLGRNGTEQSATILVTIAKAVVLCVGVLVILQSAGISITPLLTALGVGGLAVALALQDTLANLFAGIHILASKKVQQGDFVRLDTGEEGYIVDINWRNTSIRQIFGNVIIVPNAKFADAILTNFHRPAEDLTVLVPVGVSYDSDLDHVEAVTVEVAAEVLGQVEGGVEDYKPIVRFNAFGDSAIELNAFLRTHEYTDQYLVVHEFIKRLHERYRDEGIEIPFPMRNLVLRGGTWASPPA